MTRKEIELLCERAAEKAVEKYRSAIGIKADVGEYVTTKEAARILGLTETYFRTIKDRFPHRKGEGPTGRLLFLKSALLPTYTK